VSITDGVASEIFRGERHQAHRLGPKLEDGLKVYAIRGIAVRAGIDRPADEMLADLGYPTRVAWSIIDRLVRRDLVEFGVKPRWGWLTDSGRRYVRDVLPRPDLPTE